tara:strand:+ start:335 stop:478 length:144 start_codon:yes stop_codon:yes gene_type:complete
MPTKHYNIEIDIDLQNEYFEKLDKAKNDDEKWELQKKYFSKIFKKIK